MPTESNIELLHSIAERHSESIFSMVYELVKGIALQNIWRNTTGDLVYTQDLDLETIRCTVLEIIMGTSPYSVWRPAQMGQMPLQRIPLIYMLTRLFRS